MQTASSNGHLAREHAQEFTEALGQVLGGAVRLAEWAPEVGIPQALGLSPAEWAERRLAGQVRLNVAERRQVVEANPDKSTRELGEALGVGKDTIARDRKGVAHATPVPPPSAGPDEKPVAHATPEPGPQRTRGQLANQNGGTDEWATPQDFFDVLSAEFGFELDVCALPSSAKCERYFTPKDDGLAQEWIGTCWMNPPYGDEIGRWVEKAWQASQNGATVVCLLPARTDTGWWWDYCRHGEVRFLRGRLRFGDASASAPFPSAVVIFGRDPCVVWWEWR